MVHGDPMLTLGVAALAGVSLFVLSARLRVPPIALLLPGGVLLGPMGLGWVQPAGLGPALHEVVGLAVAVILFEGGLALDLAGYRRAPVVIGRMLSVGVLITWLGIALALWLGLGLPFAVAAVARMAWLETVFMSRPATSAHFLITFS